MNHLYVGFNKTIEPPKGGFLLIDDEPRKIPGARVFDPRKHSFNPLHQITYKKARELADVLYTISPQGENTLTVRNGRRALLKVLLKTRRLDLIRKADEEVTGMIDDLLASPVLRGVLCKETEPFWFNKNSKIVARINRADLGEFDALVLGLFLISHYKGQVIIPDGGLYLREAHVSLLREKRLIVGVNTLSELPPKLRQLLLLEEKEGSGTTYEDAVELAKYKGLRPDLAREDNDYNRFIDRVTA